MLRIHQYKTLNEKWLRLQDFDLNQSTWLVSDLKSKSELQRRLLQRTDCLPEDAILRASELWQKIFYRHFADYELISTALTTTYLAEWLEKRDISWAKHAGTPRMLLNYIGFFLPVLAHSEDVIRLKDWLRTQPEAFLRWGNWFLLAHEAWQMFSSEKNLARPWSSAFLAGQESLDWSAGGVWSRELIFDLGPDLTAVEVDLIQQLARNHNVEVIAPSKELRDAHGSSLWPYSLLLGEDIKIRPQRKKIEFDSSGEAAGVDISTQAQTEYARLSSPLAEIKLVTSKVRELLDAGVAPHEIGILAARIEDYWPVLEAYLRIEGIPVAKDVVMTTGSLPTVARWLARARIEAQQISSGDLEHSLFGLSNDSPPLSFDEYAPLYRQIYEADDLSRDSRVQKLFKKKFEAKDKIDRDTFFVWMLKFWEGDLLGLERIAAEFLQECPTLLRLEVRSWLRYLETLVAKIEIKIGDGGSGDGVICGNFDAAAHLELRAVFAMGLSEGQLSEEKNLAVSLSDVIKLTNDLGLRMPELSSMPGEFWVDTITRQTREQICLIFAATNIGGDPETPSLIWLRGAQQKLENLEACQTPPTSRWDEIQHHPFRLGDDGAGSELERLSNIELGRQPADLIEHKLALRYSASQLEKYQSCPFIFAAEKMFRLSEKPDVDLDIDAMTSGQLIHAVLDFLMTEPLSLSRSKGEIQDVVERVRTQMAFTVAVEALWPKQREKYVNIAEKFLKFESEWRRQYPQTKTMGREVMLKGELEISAQKKINVSGKIDRIDRNTAGEYVILDYKSSGYELRNYDSWLEKDELQLLFYSLCIEQGLVEVEKGAVIGAFYFILNSMNREKGFRNLAKVGTLFGESKSTQLERDALDAMYVSLKNKVAGIVEKIEIGQVGPNPKKNEECTTCDWKTVCRAPHLN